MKHLREANLSVINEAVGWYFAGPMDESLCAAKLREAVARLLEAKLTTVKVELVGMLQEAKPQWGSDDYRQAIRELLEVL